MGHREAAKRTSVFYDIVTGSIVLTVIIGAVSGYLVYKHHEAAIKVLGGAIGALWILTNVRRAAGRRLKYHFDRVNITNLTASWGGKRKRRERIARIIGRF